MPKKRGAVLRIGEGVYAEVGWGSHLVDGFLPYKVCCLFTSFFLLVSLVFAVTWAAKTSGIQGAFGVAAYVCALASLVYRILCGIFGMRISEGIASLLRILALWPRGVLEDA